MAERTTLMVNGLPGKMSKIIAGGILTESRGKYDLMDVALTGPNQLDTLILENRLSPAEIHLIPPEEHENTLKEIVENYKNRKVITIDFCKGKGVADRNVQLYCKYRIPFVQGSTGGDPDLPPRLAEETRTPCVVYPNMDLRIVAWIAGIEHMAKEYAGAFRGSKISLEETHQADKIKADGTPETSGTMKRTLKAFNRLLGDGNLVETDISSIRDRKTQAGLFGVPEKWLGWHAYHFFKVYDEHDGVEDSEELIFKRHGGESYRRGAMLAVDFLADGKNNKYFNNMIDVLRTN